MVLSRRTQLLVAVIFGMASSVVAQCKYTITHTVTSTENGRVTRHQSTYVETIEAYDVATVDRQPTFPGGMNALYGYINKSRRYPSEAYHNGVQGRVLCSFVVNSDGSVSHVNVIKGIEPSLDSEAVRIIEDMPKWNAGEIDDKPVPIYCILPIVFRL